MEDHLTKQEQRKLEQGDRERSAARAHFIRKAFRRSVLGAVIFSVLGYFVWFVANQPVPAEADIVSRNGIHWHPHVSIVIKGKEETIPAGIGLGVIHDPMHTHDPDGVIHLEYERPGTIVTKDDTRIGKFFDVWGKRFTKDCIFDNCNGPDGTLRFLVNGVPNDAFEHYAMRDNDKIEIIFE